MSIRVLMHSFNSPEENLSAEEYLFNKKKQLDDRDEDILRIWESNTYFVVLGSSQSVLEEVFLDKCISNDIKVIRRCSAGGAVLQGPGCVNYSLFLNLNKHPQMRNIRNSYYLILSMLKKTLSEEYQLETKIEGISDLCYCSKKISGNAQRRNSSILLHHGTLLYDINFELLENVLKIPKIQPLYRCGRRHREFVGTLPLKKKEIADCILKTFAMDSFSSSFSDLEIAEISQLADIKYSKNEWNFKR